MLFYANDCHFGMGMANLRYMTHIASKADAFAVFPVDGDPVVWVETPWHHIPDGSLYRYTQDWVKDIRPNTGPTPVASFLRDQQYDHGTIGLVGMTTAVGGDINLAPIYDYFHRELPDAKIIDVTGLMDYLRMIKSPEEIIMLEKAGELARKTIDTMIQSAEPGKKECELYADMVHTQISNGGEAEIFNFLSSGPVEGPMNKDLLHGAIQPIAPTMRTLEMGDLVITEFHANWGGYLAGAEFSVYLGKAPGELKRIHEVCVQCFEQLLEKMRPGNKFEEVLDAVREPCKRAGMDFVELGFHGHGVLSPEMPTAVCSSGAPIGAGEKISRLEVRENMVFGTNIDIHDPKWKTDVGLMLGDTLHVTKDGARRLVDIPLDYLEKIP
ncbi:M24 family metallopeptidase [Chloroflexota bacterium]